MATPRRLVCPPTAAILIVPLLRETLTIPDALERLVRLYEAKGNEPEAAAWRSKLEAARAE
jgi:hypothetical protein